MSIYENNEIDNEMDSLSYDFSTYALHVCLRVEYEEVQRLKGHPTNW